MKDLYKIMLTNVCYSTDLQCESLCIHGRSRTPVPTIKIQFTLVNPNLSYKLTKKVNAVALRFFFLFIGKMRDLSALQNLDYVSLLLREKVARFSVTDE